MAEALLAQGFHEDAVREARIALDVSPGFDRAQSILVRALPESERTHRMIKRGWLAFERGATRKAERMLKRAFRVAGDQCSTCRRELATFYERSGRLEEAIHEWRRYEAAAPDQARAEDVATRINTLKAKLK
jgi:tetratricopeptide (TPR) repeat protein